MRWSRPHLAAGPAPGAHPLPLRAMSRCIHLEGAEFAMSSGLFCLDYGLDVLAAGFGRVEWSPIRTPPPDDIRDEAFWRRYRDHPVSSLMTCS